MEENDFEIKKAKTRQELAQRKLAYCHTFNPENTLVKKVLQDLAKFCRANASTFHADHRIHAVLEGRREVWLRIQQHTQLTSEQLLELLK